MALRMYAYGAVRTLSEAAEAMDLSVSYLSLVHNSIPGQEFMKAADAIIAERALEGNALLDAIGQRALEVIASKMENSKNENISLKAAIDLADRSPTYSKVQKHQVESISLSGKDVSRLAEALAQGPRVHEKFAHLANGDYNRITDGNPPSNGSATDS